MFIFLENLRLLNLTIGSTIHTKDYLMNSITRFKEIQFLVIPKEELI